MGLVIFIVYFRKKLNANIENLFTLAYNKHCKAVVFEKGQMINSHISTSVKR